MSLSPKRRLRVLVATAAAFIAGAAGAVALPVLDPGAAVAQTACGANSPQATVTGSSGAYVTKEGPTSLLRPATTAAPSRPGLTHLQRTARRRHGLGLHRREHHHVQSGKIFQAAGRSPRQPRRGRGAIEATDTTDATSPSFSLSATRTSASCSPAPRPVARRDRPHPQRRPGHPLRPRRAGNYNVMMDAIYVSGAGSHAVETWNIDGLKINKVIARNVGESGLLIQNSGMPESAWSTATTSPPAPAMRPSAWRTTTAGSRAAATRPTSGSTK